MPIDPGGILGKILKNVGRRLKERKKAMPLSRLRKMRPRRKPPDFIRAISGGKGLAIIAEIKRSSPSSPRLRPGLDLLDFARRYRSAGAAAISVLTEQDHFGGSLEDLRRVSEAIDIPVLRKDFTIDEYQIYEAKAFGAAAILLIVRILKKTKLMEFHRLATRLQMATLVEVHDEKELETALSIGATLIGVNNRNLTTLKTDIRVCLRLLPRIPKHCVAVAESGYSRYSELEELRGLADAVLIGTAFLKDPRKLRAHGWIARIFGRQDVAGSKMRHILGRMSGRDI